jgi:transposase
MLTVVATCRQQGINVLDYLTRCYQAHLDDEPVPSLLPLRIDFSGSLNGY